MIRTTHPSSPNVVLASGSSADGPDRVLVATPHFAVRDAAGNDIVTAAIEHETASAAVVIESAGAVIRSRQGETERWTADHVDLAIGDRLLLCTATLADGLDPSEIRRVLRIDAPADELATFLLARARAAGMHDDLAALILELRVEAE